VTKKLSKIAFIFLFTLGAFLGPLSVVRAQNTPDNVPDYSNRLQNCVFAHPTDGTGTFEGCLVSGFYYLILVPSGWFAYQSGRLFDFFMAYSLDSNSYTGGNGDFVNQGWAVIRDIANVLFIFTLLYIAITHILQAGTSGTKKLLTGLIVAALLINFSLFFSKIIIDGGNILARVFYNNIEVTYDDHPDGSDIHTISQALAATAPPFLSYFRALSEDRLSQKPHERADRTHVEIFHLLTWHEAHHQGQCHLAMNCFMAGR
jgi:hypothetical protein